MIRALARQLSPALQAEETAAAPTDAQTVAALKSTADTLNRLAESASGQGADAVRRLATSLTKLSQADKAKRDAAQAAFIVPLRIALNDLRDYLHARAGQPANPAGGHQAGLDCARRQGARRGVSEGRSQRQRNSAAIRKRRSGAVSRSGRNADLDPRVRQDRRPRILPGRRVRAGDASRSCFGSCCAASATCC